jgi:hypothetical protein
MVHVFLVTRKDGKKWLEIFKRFINDFNESNDEFKFDACNNLERRDERKTNKRYSAGGKLSQCRRKIAIRRMLVVEEGSSETKTDCFIGQEWNIWSYVGQKNTINSCLLQRSISWGEPLVRPIYTLKKRGEKTLSFQNEMVVWTNVHSKHILK